MEDELVVTKLSYLLAVFCLGHTQHDLCQGYVRTISHIDTTSTVCGEGGVYGSNDILHIIFSLIPVKENLSVLTVRNCVKTRMIVPLFPNTDRDIRYLTYIGSVVDYNLEFAVLDIDCLVLLSSFWLYL